MDSMSAAPSGGGANVGYALGAATRRSVTSPYQA
jgi:hypothetical protein